jgi:DNA repair and recombination protein RAD54 and RAD54-like protein
MPPPLASSVPSSALAHRPRHTYENSATISSTLSKPFRPPLAKRTSLLPARKKRKVTSYAEETLDDSSKDSSFTTDGIERVPLGGLDINALKSRRRESGEVFRKTFVVPAKENNGLFSMERKFGYAPASLGMLRPANFVPRPLHDPAGEFAIVLYDPTIDDEPPPKIPDGTCIGFPALMLVTEVVEKKVESKVHKSLAEILGIPKRGEPVKQQKVAVLIDPKIAKVLRPHQVEGVKAPP